MDDRDSRSYFPEYGAKEKMFSFLFCLGDEISNNNKIGITIPQESVSGFGRDGSP
jgi:hypothetical protein